MSFGLELIKPRLIPTTDPYEQRCTEFDQVWLASPSAFSGWEEDMARNHSEGKLTQSDEGELEFKITPYKGRVIMDWGKLAQWIGMARTHWRSS
jgi:hypothetical protein